MDLIDDTGLAGIAPRLLTRRLRWRQLMSEGPTLDVWLVRLKDQGHRIIEPSRDSVIPFTLWPAPDTIITVAVEPDEALHRRSRERFFLCEQEADQVFRVTGCPQPHRGRWLELVSQQPPGYWQDFLAGPGSWLLSRVARFNRVVAWSSLGLAWEYLDCPTHRAWGLEPPDDAIPFFAATAGPDAARPRLLPVHHRRFADLVAACLLFASVGLRDCYLADEAGAEVYLAHHHGKVVVSVPDAGERAGVLRELASKSWLFTDVSGYASSIDDDEDQDG